MKLGINAFNIRVGGGLVHLVELLSAANPLEYGFNEVVVWANSDTLAKLPERFWLKKVPISFLSKSWPYKLAWLFYRFPKEARSCDILFFPGGSYLGSFKPYVTMLQNMLPFDAPEAKRYLNASLKRFLKWKLLYFSQSLTLKRSNGAIFPSYYAKESINVLVPQSRAIASSVIPHGINTSFSCMPSAVFDRPHSKKIRLLYISAIDIYKHQWQVVRAVGLLRHKGLDVSLELVGPSGDKRAQYLLENALKEIDPEQQFVHYLGAIPYAELPKIYQSTDIFVFASSCESISNIVLEAMKAGLPIACSNKSVMPEVLSDAGVYFDPEQPHSIAHAIETLIDNPQLRIELAQKAYDRASVYTWKKCADETFSFIADIARTAMDIRTVKP